jgi:hypothetical protein
MRALRPLLLAGASLVALCAPGVAAAATPGADPWAGVEIIEETEMADLRGGFKLPSGPEVNFGAVVSTYSGGMLAMQTELTVTDVGAIVEQSMGELGRALSSLTDEEAEQLGVAGLGENGVVIADEQGVTALVQNFAEGGLQNIIFNTASGRDLRQHIDVTIELPDYAAFERAMSNELVGLRLSNDLGDALVAQTRGP